jgi:glycosyltransferase involved in cell wall biosynthesis
VRRLKALIAIDHHFVRDRTGEVYVGHPFAITGYAFFEPYLKVFDEVLVLARVRQQADPPSRVVQASGAGVTFHDLPDYLGPWEYFRYLARLRRGVRCAIEAADVFILRVPGAIGQLAWKALRRSAQPYAVEVVADPWDMYSPGAVPTILRPIVRRYSFALLRAMCACAPCVSYVTREALQKRYPPGPRTWATYASDVDIQSGVADTDQIRERVCRLARISRQAVAGATGMQIGFVGSFAQMYKAPDILLRATASCVRDGLRFSVAFVGDGKYRVAMEKLTRELGISSSVFFLGALPPGPAVQKFMETVDLFVLPSRQEGLPRALVEAMAQGCPCVGSTVGGIPELLAAEDLVPPGDAGALAAKIREVLHEPGRLERMARRNWERAKEFQPAVLSERRLSFYGKLCQQAEDWQDSRLTSAGVA